MEKERTVKLLHLCQSRLRSTLVGKQEILYCPYCNVIIQQTRLLRLTILGSVNLPFYPNTILLFQNFINMYSR